MNRLLSPLITAIFAVLLFRAGAAPKELPPLELPVPPEALKETTNGAYGIYVLGTKSGWGLMSQAPARHEGRDVINIAFEMNLEMKTIGNSLKVETRSRQVFDAAPPYRAVLLEEVQKMDGQERRTILRHREGTTYSVELMEAGKTRAGKDVTFDFRFNHVTSATVWCADPARKTGDAAGTLEFDFESMTLKPQNTTFLKEAEWVGPGGKLPVWELEHYDFASGAKIISRISRADGSPVNFSFGSLFEVRMEPEAVAKQKPGKTPDLFLALTIKSDRKLGSADKLTALELELSAAEGEKAPQLAETVNQKIVRRGDSSITLLITKGKGTPQPATEEERSDNLKATTRYPASEEEIKKLAAEAIGNAADDAHKVKNLLRFTDNYLRDSYAVEALTVMDLLKSRKGECSAHALLFTTLARAAGIPAREAGGWLYMGDSYQSFGGHAWNEVILDGHWVPVDAIFQQFQLDAGHIQSHGGDKNGKSAELLSAGLRGKVISSGRE